VTVSDEKGRPGVNGAASQRKSKSIARTKNTSLLSAEHADQLAASGITAEHAAARGYRTCGPGQQSYLGYTVKVVKPGRRIPGLLIPLLRADGSTWGYQYRPDDPRLRDGKPIKYETPWQQRNGLDVPPGVGPLLSDPTIPLFVTEGSKKADAGALHGLCIVSLTGVWGWLGTNSAGGKMALADWHDVALNGRRVILAFDGDVARKSSVQKALHALAQYLTHKGTTIEYLWLPDTDDKTGLDDYLVAGNTVEDLWKLVKPTPPTPVKPKSDADPQVAQPAVEPANAIEAADVNGADLLDDVQQFAGRFLALPTSHHYVALALWAAHTWAVSAFYVTPRLVLDSPEPGCAKTRVLEVLNLLCCNAKLTLSTTTAALYRRIAAAGDTPPTVLQDEADAVFGKTTTPQTEDLRALFNAGYKRGATVDRCEGDAKHMVVREFPVFAPVALAGLAGKVPNTILDRAVVFHMRHRAADEQIDEFRERDAAVDAAPLTERLSAWATANFDALAASRPKMPTGVRDRPAEVWEALIAVADVAGGEWPRLARAACTHFVLDTDDSEPSLGMRLLADVLKVFDDRIEVDAMFSAELVWELTKDAEAEWGDLWGRPLDQRRLAKELRRYGVRSKSVRIGDSTAKGYQIDGDDGLAQAWRHYLGSTCKRHKRFVRNSAGQSIFDPSHDPSQASHDPSQRHTSVTPKTASELCVSETVTAVTAVTHADGSRNGHTTEQPRLSPVTGPGRCPVCSFHVPTQGHRPGCIGRDR